MTTTLDAAPASVPASAATTDHDPTGRPSAADRLRLAGLLIATAVLYLWNITINGNANSFYAGAAWAGSRDWKALLFGSVDPSNFITVDKPPASQWVMGLSGQIFGFSSASMLIPEALMGIASVALMYAMVTRLAGRPAGLLAGAALAVTPVAAMMFRFNNPDAAMVLLMTAAAYCTVRANARGSVRWLALAGAALGFAFLAKMLEGLMVIPALAAMYLVAAPVGWTRRIRDLVITFVAFIVSAGWYVVLTLLWPASSRPYLAGSTDNNFMNLVLGYNGLDRVSGNAHGGAGHGHGRAGMTAMLGELERQNPDLAHRLHGGGMFGNGPGITRLFSGEFGGEISFLLPAALVALVAVLILRGRRPRTDIVRAGALMFGLWLVVDGLVLSFMGGMAHPYYSLAIAPPIAGLVAIGTVECLRSRHLLLGRGGAAAIVAAAGIWSFVLLDREPTWQPWLRWTVLVVTVLVAALMFVPPGGRRRVTTVAGLLAGVAMLTSPAAYAINGDTVAQTGGSPSVLPQSDSPLQHGGRGSHGGGGFNGAPVPKELAGMLASSHARWAAATNRTAAASSVELAAHVPVMGIGGFMDDPTPSLGEFQNYVAHKDIGYYLTVDPNSMSIGGARLGPAAQRMMRSFGRRQGSTGTAIQQWVTTHYRDRHVGDYLVYDLSVPPTAQPIPANAG